MGVIRQWTQTVKLSKNILEALERDDVHLLDLEGTPFAVLVKLDRYDKLQEK